MTLFLWFISVMGQFAITRIKYKYKCFNVLLWDVLLRGHCRIVPSPPHHRYNMADNKKKFSIYNFHSVDIYTMPHNIPLRKLVRSGKSCLWDGFNNNCLTKFLFIMLKRRHQKNIDLFIFVRLILRTHTHFIIFTNRYNLHK